MDARPAVLSARPGRVVYVSTSTRKSLVFQPPAACKTSAQLLAAIDAAHAAQYPDQAQTRFTALYVVHNNRPYRVRRDALFAPLLGPGSEVLAVTAEAEAHFDAAPSAQLVPTSETRDGEHTPTHGAATLDVEAAHRDGGGATAVMASGGGYSQPPAPAAKRGAAHLSGAADEEPSAKRLKAESGAAVQAPHATGDATTTTTSSSSDATSSSDDDDDDDDDDSSSSSSSDDEERDSDSPSSSSEEEDDSSLLDLGHIPFTAFRGSSDSSDSDSDSSDSESDSESGPAPFSDSSDSDSDSGSEGSDESDSGVSTTSDDDDDDSDELARQPRGVPPHAATEASTRPVSARAIVAAVMMPPSSSSDSESDSDLQGGLASPGPRPAAPRADVHALGMDLAPAGATPEPEAPPTVVDLRAANALGSDTSSSSSSGSESESDTDDSTDGSDSGGHAAAAPAPPAVRVSVPAPFDLLRRTLATSSSPHALSFILDRVTSKPLTSSGGAAPGSAEQLLEEARRHGLLTDTVTPVVSPQQLTPPLPGHGGPAAQNGGGTAAATPRAKRGAAKQAPAATNKSKGPAAPGSQSALATARFAAAARAHLSQASSVSVEEVTHTPAWLSAAQPSQPARVNLAWLTHLAGSSRSTGTAAVDQQPLLRALAAALPELGLYVELPLVARGVPGEAFIGGASGRTAAAHRARAQRAGSTLDYPVVAALLRALQAWTHSIEGSSAPTSRVPPADGADALAAYGAPEPAERVQLLVTIALCGVAQRPAFNRAARQALSSAVFAGGPTPLATALALPERARHLIPAYAALNDVDQAAIRAAVDAYDRMMAISCGEAPAQVLTGIRFTALSTALATWLCLRAGSPCTARNVQPHAVDPFFSALLSRCLAVMAADDAPLLPQKHVITEADAPVWAFHLLRTQCCSFHPLFDADIMTPYLGAAYARVPHPNNAEEDDIMPLLCATLRLVALCNWTNATPDAVLAILRAERTVEDILLAELGGAARDTSAVGPRLAFPGLATAVRRVLAPGSADSSTRAMLAGVRALCVTARDACLPYDGNECGVWAVDCSALCEAMRVGSYDAKSSTAAAVRFATLCRDADVARLSVSVGVVELHGLRS